MASLIVVVIFMFILVVRVIAIENDNSFKLRRQSLLSKFHLVTLTESPTLHLPIPIVICYFTFPQEGVLPVQTDEPTPANENPNQPKGPWLLGRMVSLAHIRKTNVKKRPKLVEISRTPEQEIVTPFAQVLASLREVTHIAEQFDCFNEHSR